MLNKIRTIILKFLYPIKDNIWISRRWNRSKTDWIDLGDYK